MGYWESFEFGDIEIIHTPAQHWGARFVHDTHRSFGGYIIKYAGARDLPLRRQRLLRWLWGDR